MVRVARAMYWAGVRAMQRVAVRAMQRLVVVMWGAEVVARVERIGGGNHESRHP